MTTVDAEDNQSNDNVCPKCGREFKDRHGMNMHHVQVHGGSITREELTCDQCGDVFEVKPSHKDKRRFCSKDCQAEHLSGVTGEDHPLWDREELECPTCGDSFQVKTSHAPRRKYCSNECYAEGKAEITGPDHPLWERVEMECGVCGSAFYSKPAHTERREYCSKECLATAQEDRVGPAHPSWIPGETRYGSGWTKNIKQEVRERDDRVCQVCGMTSIQHRMKHGCRLHVHHIIPARKFDESGKGNEPDNLVTLCAGCHADWEGIPLRPQTD
jgi:5-methylcytosine-specific restriction endonuclease McrA